jgi:hypothetical protein
MPEISFDNSKIPLWSGATGAVVINADVENPAAPLTPGDNPIVDAAFRVDGNQDISLGSAGSVAIGVNAGAQFKLAPLWKHHINAAPEIVSSFNLGSALRDDNMLLALELGANVDLSAAGSFHYSVLSAGATLQAGADAGLVYVRSFPRATAFGAELADFFTNLRLPANVTTPPDSGELIAFEFGGYLKLGASASAGYELKGTKSFDVGQLQLSEYYDLSVTGKLSVNASLAGRFSVEVRAGSEPGWASVTVRRKRTKDLQILADLNIGASLDTQGLPASGKEFLGALIGIRAKNWLNLIDSAADQAGQMQNIDNLKAKLDGLAVDFISKYAGKAVDQLLPAETTALTGRLQKVVDSYNKLDNSAIALFDRYFDPVLDKTKELEGRLQDLSKLASWDALKGEVDPMLWNIVRQLTGGDPLGWMLGQIPGTNKPSLDEFIARVNGALALIQSGAHDEIRKIITLAKSEFGLDRFISELHTVNTPDTLKTALSNEARHFVERILHVQIDKLNSKDLKAAFAIVQNIVKAKDAFWAKFDAALKEAAQRAFSLAISASYSNADEQTSLIDVDIRLMDVENKPVPVGHRFMALAGRGDFQDILASYQPDVVRLRQGALTHNSATATGIKINIAGWHLNYQYEEMYRVIVNADQQIRPTGNGMLNVFTTVDMTDDKQRRRRTTKSEQEMHTNFILRFLGETHGALNDGKFDKQDESYLIDVITGLSAFYNLTFTDSNTTPGELRDAFLFAATVGLDKVGATVAAVAPILEFKDGHFGPITAEYAVGFTASGLKRLFSQNVTADDIRAILRKIVLANYFGQGNIADVGWLYVSDDVRKLWAENLNNFVDAESILGDAIAAQEVHVVSPIPGVLPGPVSNTFENRVLVSGLFQVERQMVAAFTGLQTILRKAGGVKLLDFRNSLKAFGEALKSFDNSSLGDNTTFAVFDGLVQLTSPGADARSSSMSMTSVKGGQQHQINFVLQRRLRLIFHLELLKYSKLASAMICLSGAPVSSARRRQSSYSGA